MIPEQGLDLLYGIKGPTKRQIEFRDKTGMRISLLNLAKGEYNLALSLKPNEKYPQNKLKEIADYFAEIQKEFEANYAVMIAGADELFDAKEFAQAKEQYELALTVKPDDAYPRQRLEDIKEQLAFIEKQNTLDASYEEMLAEGDNLYANGHYDLAL